TAPPPAPAPRGRPPPQGRQDGPGSAIRAGPLRACPGVRGRRAPVPPQATYTTERLALELPFRRNAPILPTTLAPQRWPPAPRSPHCISSFLLKRKKKEVSRITLHPKPDDRGERDGAVRRTPLSAPGGGAPAGRVPPAGGGLRPLPLRGFRRRPPPHEALALLQHPLAPAAGHQPGRGARRGPVVLCPVGAGVHHRRGPFRSGVRPAGRRPHPPDAGPLARPEGALPQPGRDRRPAGGPGP